MRTDHSVNVKYTKYSTDVVYYDSSLVSWVNIEGIYRNETLRDKVVCRFDAVPLLTKYFLPETLRDYRPVVLRIAEGLYTDPNEYSGLITSFMEVDSVFKASIVNIFHSCPEDECFGEYIVKVLASELIRIEAEYRSFFRGKQEVVVCLSDGYIYFSFDDREEGPTLLDRVECEVLSNVKNWGGNIKFLRS